MAAIDETHKQCKKCNELLTVKNFYLQKQRGTNGQLWEYYDPYCKSCRLIYGNKRRKTIKREAIDYKGGKCFDCGLTDECSDIFDFHHLDPLAKDFTISKTAKKFDSIKLELDKCILLCANCHRKRHSSE